MSRPRAHRSLASWLPETHPSRWGNPAPGLTVLRNYQRSWLRPDILAGITVAAYLVPQVMAYAQIAGLPPNVGLIAFLAPALAYALFGSSRQLSVGPESTTALMTATALATLGVSSEQYRGFAGALALVVGVLCLLGWLGGLGFLADLLSKPVLVGYLAGVAALMIISQIPKLTGIPTSGDSLLQEVASAVRNAGQAHWPTIAVASFSLQDYGIKTVGAVPNTLPLPALPSLALSDIGPMVLPAVGIAVVAYSDNILTARGFAGKTGARIDADQEFLGLGVANVAAGVFQGFPVSSSGSRTAIGASIGSKTQLYSLVSAATVILVILFGGPILAAFPTAALGALVFYAATKLVDVPEFRRIAAFSRSEFLISLATAAAVLIVGVLNGILFAIALSVANLVRRVARPHDGVLGYVPGLAGMHDVDDFDNAAQIPGLVVYRYDSTLFFANADDFLERATRSVDLAPSDVQWLILNAEANVDIDLTSLDALISLCEAMQERGVRVVLSRVKQDLLGDLKRGGVVGLVGAENIYPTLPTAVEAYLTWYADEHGALPAGFQLAQPPPQSPVARSEVPRSEVSKSEVSKSEVSSPDITGPDVAPSEVDPA